MKLCSALLFGALCLACASSGKPPNDPDQCSFWREAPQENRLSVVRGSYERMMTNVESRGEIPKNWTEVKSCLRSQYGGQVSAIEAGCKSGEKPMDIFNQKVREAYEKCPIEK